MKKRRELLQAMKEDSRISSLEGKLQRVSSEVEAYRRFTERTEAVIGDANNSNKNQVEQLQQLVKEEQESKLELENTVQGLKKNHATEIQGKNQTIQNLRDDIERMTIEMEALQKLLVENSNKSNEKPFESEESKSSQAFSSIKNEKINQALGPASIAHISNQRKVENELKLSKLEVKKLERECERANRRAQRAEQEINELKNQIKDLQTEQHVKDAQLDSMRTDLQDYLSSSSSSSSSFSARRKQNPNQTISTPRTPVINFNSSIAFSESKHSPNFQKEANGFAGQGAKDESKFDEQDAESDHESIQDVMESELHAMRESYEKKVQTLQDELQGAKKEIKELNKEIGSLRGF